jgi:anaerobic ribonucleoside-triphosphate reductase activating protein
VTAIAVSRLHFPVTTLGPGRRIGIWFQGCSIRCAGCISIDTWPTGRGITDVDRVLDVVMPWLAGADGITISGGEPFEQPEALHQLLVRLRLLTRVTTLVYSGYSFEKLASWLEQHSGLIDALISEPYEHSVPQTMALRGSDNQRLHLLTPAGTAAFSCFNRPATADDRRLDAMFNADGSVWFAGVPARGDLVRLREALTAAGHNISISEGSS